MRYLFRAEVPPYVHDVLLSPNSDNPSLALEHTTSESPTALLGLYQVSGWLAPAKESVTSLAQ